MFTVAYADHQPPECHNLLMTITLLVTGEDPVVLRMDGAAIPCYPEGVPYYYIALGGWEPWCGPMNPATGYERPGEFSPLATINGSCFVDAAALTWGSVKAVYR
jgi:hypothetical protein